MHSEIERKFLMSGDGWRRLAGPGQDCRQGYITSGRSGATVRVRLLDGRGFLTVKGPAEGIGRAEMEYGIPPLDAEYMLGHLCGGRVISKTRYPVQSGGMFWEIDEFHGDNEGLVLAEIELDRADREFEIPDWIGAEVSGDSRYYNAALALRPFRSWTARPGDL